MFSMPNRCCATVTERSASIARPPATTTSNSVVVDATFFPLSSVTISPGKTSLNALATAAGIPTARGVVAVDDDGPQRYRLGELPPNGLLVVVGLFRKHVRVEVA